METTLRHVEYTLNLSYEENIPVCPLKYTQRIGGVPPTLRAKTIFKYSPSMRKLHQTGVAK